MYNVEDLGGRKVDYLHLSRSTVAKIFMGEITRWTDPAIAADNTAGQPAAARRADQRRLPRRPVGHDRALLRLRPRDRARRSSRRGRPRNRLPTNVPHHPARQLARLRPEDPGAQRLRPDRPVHRQRRRASGRSPTTSSATPRSTARTSAWIENASGKWVLPYAENISAALESAHACGPTSARSSSGVYPSPNPLAYPISAYSYLVTQCETAGDRPTVPGPVLEPRGHRDARRSGCATSPARARSAWPSIGYSPLPPNLSQEVANSIARMTGESVPEPEPGQLRQPPVPRQPRARARSALAIPTRACRRTPVAGAAAGEEAAKVAAVVRVAGAAEPAARMPTATGCPTPRTLMWAEPTGRPRPWPMRGPDAPATPARWAADRPTGGLRHPSRTSGALPPAAGGPRWSSRWPSRSRSRPGRWRVDFGDAGRSPSPCEPVPPAGALAPDRGTSSRPGIEGDRASGLDGKLERVTVSGHGVRSLRPAVRAPVRAGS